MMGTEWAIGAFAGHEAQLDRSRFLEAIVDEAFGKLPADLSVIRNVAQEGRQEGQEAAGGTNGPGADQEG